MESKKNKNRRKIEVIKELLTPTYPRILESLDEQNKKLRKRLAIELKKSRVKEKTLKEIKKDNFNLSREIENYIKDKEKTFSLKRRFFL